MTSSTQPLIWEIRQSPIRLVSIKRPYCFAHSRYREEQAVVAKAIDALLTVFAPTEIEYQYNLGSGCRPDIACFRDLIVFITEVKAGAVTEATVRQATRYLEVARERWPDRTVTVACVGTSLSARLGPAPDGISYGVVQ